MRLPLLSKPLGTSAPCLRELGPCAGGGAG